MVDYLKSHNLVHPDIAPNNIMWNGKTSKIIDLKTMTALDIHNKYWSNSASFNQSIINNKLKIKGDFLSSISSPWRLG